ncbi:MAG TPA: molybdenum cofactor guanylyltransferase [Phnomibacter sp.]|nr:molybdenum cofactor guanylyltransferase [Phnomibacter sp.]
MLGVLLCGGMSTRMGHDKGLIPLTTGIMAKQVAANFEALAMPYVLSIRQQQAKAYENHFNPSQFVLDHIPQIGGPLQGLLSVHSHYPGQPLLVIACDMPGMSLSLLQHLKDVYNLMPEKSWYAYRLHHQLQPMCAIYQPKCMAQMLHLHQQQLLTRHSLQYLLEQQEGVALDVPAHLESCFANLNTRQELINYRV